jgi:1-acyl-sn-glycerol-3-phosphate acyltransferase
VLIKPQVEEPLNALASAIFAISALLFSAVAAFLFLPALILPRKQFQRVAAQWCRVLIVLLRICCGLRWQIVGCAHLPAGKGIIAAKHQSAWDTLIFHILLTDPVYVLKRELMPVPFLGWYLRKAGNVPIDRSAGSRALRIMKRAVDQALAEDATVIIFPEGTRTAPGQRVPYQPGIAALYQHTDAPVVPAALNSGLFWGRRGLPKRSGVITIEILPPMPRGLKRADFLAELEKRIEETTSRLCHQHTPDLKKCADKKSTT